MIFLVGYQKFRVEAFHANKIDDIDSGSPCSAAQLSEGDHLFYAVRILERMGRWYISRSPGANNIGPTTGPHLFESPIRIFRQLFEFLQNVQVQVAGDLRDTGMLRSLTSSRTLFWFDIDTHT